MCARLIIFECSKRSSQLRCLMGVNQRRIDVKHEGSRHPDTRIIYGSSGSIREMWFERCSFRPRQPTSAPEPSPQLSLPACLGALGEGPRHIAIHDIRRDPFSVARASGCIANVLSLLGARFGGARSKLHDRIDTRGGTADETRFGLRMPSRPKLQLSMHIASSTSISLRV